MANESNKKASSSSSSPVPSMSSASSSRSSSSGDSYIGSFISLTSKYEIRYEGVLYHLNPQDSTLGLKSVRSYGTEGRKKDGPQIPPSDKVYEYILFRGSDIKDLQVKSFPAAQKEDPILNDPAVIQSQCTVGPASSLKSVCISSGPMTEVKSSRDLPVSNNIVHPVMLPSYRSGTKVSSGGSLQAAQNANVTSVATPRYWEGSNGNSDIDSYVQQLPNPLVSASTSTSSLSAALQSKVQPPAMQVAHGMGLLHSSNGLTSASFPTTNSVQFNVEPPLAPNEQLNLTLASSVKSSLSAHPPSGNRLVMSSFPSADMNTFGNLVTAKTDLDSMLGYSVNPLPSCASSLPDSTSGLLYKTGPNLLTPDQLAQPRLSQLSSMKKTYPDQKNMVSFSTVSSINASAIPEPLLPLPLSEKQSQYSMAEFTEEFDFEAMNEKFKKEEVWGYLGNTRQRDKTEGIENDTIYQNLGNVGTYGSEPKIDGKPAYNKDEFFDTLSCNSHARGARNLQPRFPDHIKMDNETFGHFQQRHYPGYGAYGATRGETYRDFYNWGREYSHGGRGRGGNFRI